MNRRTFLRVLGGGAVGVVLAPSVLVEQTISPPSWWRAQAIGSSSQPLTIEVLREAFERCTRGGVVAPDYIIMSRAVAQCYARMCGLVFDLEIAA